MRKTKSLLFSEKEKNFWLEISFTRISSLSAKNLASYFSFVSPSSFSKLNVEIFELSKRR
jgi:hypothetical protein